MIINKIRKIIFVVFIFELFKCLQKFSTISIILGFLSRWISKNSSHHTLLGKNSFLIENHWTLIAGNHIKVLSFFLVCNLLGFVWCYIWKVTLTSAFSLWFINRLSSVSVYQKWRFSICWNKFLTITIIRFALRFKCVWIRNTNLFS